MIYGSVCSGIEAATVAWHPLGWRPAFFAEIEKFPRAVLAHRFPEVPCHGDFTTIEAGDYEPIDLLVGGTPCQSFSSAGQRGGLGDSRGNLAIEFIDLAHRLHARWLVWENVPGVFNVDGGRAFGAILARMAERRYSVSWRVLDARFFGVPQRRRRVFLVGCAGDWRGPSQIFFEREGMRRPTRPRTAARSSPPGASAVRFGAAGEAVAKTLTTNPANRLDVTAQMFVFDRANITSPDNRSNPQPGDPAPTLMAYGGAPILTFSCKDSLQDIGDVSPTLRAMGHSGSHMNGGGQIAIWRPGSTWMRKLTPRECERLQGFPDDWTLVPYGPKGRLAADGPRYKAIGNSMAVPVMRWIGERIAAVIAMERRTA